jgi:hypothetical protein
MRRLFLILTAVVIWSAAGIYALYLNHLRLLQYQKVQTLRELRRENAKLQTEIFAILNFKEGLKFASEKGLKPIKPYRVFNFYPHLKDKPLIDFYFVWFGDTPSKIAKKLGVSLRELIRYNPSLRWGYVFPGQVLIYPVSFPRSLSAEDKKEPNRNADRNRK